MNDYPTLDIKIFQKDDVEEYKKYQRYCLKHSSRDYILSIVRLHKSINILQYLVKTWDVTNNKEKECWKRCVKDCAAAEKFEMLDIVLSKKVYDINTLIICFMFSKEESTFNVLFNRRGEKLKLFSQTVFDTLYAYRKWKALKFLFIDKKIPLPKNLLGITPEEFFKMAAIENI